MNASLVTGHSSLSLTDEQRASIRAEFPDHYFCKVIKGENERLLAIPKKHGDKFVFSMPGLTVDMLHGATIKLSVKGDAPAVLVKE